MKKKLKSIFIISTSFIIMFTNKVSYASESNVINRDILKKNIEQYTSGDKIVTVHLDNGDEVIVGNYETETEPIKVIVDKNNIQLKDSKSLININYNVLENKCIFKINETIDSNASYNEFINKVNLPQMFSICFLAITDEYGIKSEVALKYYEERLEKKDVVQPEENLSECNYVDLSKLIIEQQKNVKDIVYNYTTIKKEYIENIKYTYEVELEINLQNINKIESTNSDKININENNRENNQYNNINQNNNEDNISIKQEKLPQTGQRKIVEAIICVLIVTAIVDYYKMKHI